MSTTLDKGVMYIEQLCNHDKYVVGYLLLRSLIKDAKAGSPEAQRFIAQGVDLHKKHLEEAI